MPPICLGSLFGIWSCGVVGLTAGNDWFFCELCGSFICLGEFVPHAIVSFSLKTVNKRHPVFKIRSSACFCKSSLCS